MDPLLHYCLTGVLSLLFLSAGLEKLQDLGGFGVILRGYELIPEALLHPAIFFVTLAELVAGLSLLVPGTRTIGAWIGIFLLLAYALAIGFNLLRGRDSISCGCLGSDALGLSVLMPIRNLVLVVCAGMLLLPGIERSWSWLDSVALVASVIVAAMMYLGVNQLIANHYFQTPWRART